ncbi:MAG: GreA/GreB family elongation factor [Lentisphaeria bacterium]|nr:GreA/GreB family elongation factor [Lentisphaeria bacterium]
MDMAVLDDLVLAALDAPVKANFDALYNLLAKEAVIPAEAGNALDTLWEGLVEKLNPEAAVFCFRAAELQLPESELFRKVLVNSATTLLPPYLSRPPVMRAIGVRDEKLKIQEIASRWVKLQLLKNGTIVFLPGSKRWGVIGTIDNINGTVIVNAFSGIGVNSATPLDTVLKEAVLLAPGPELNKLVSTTNMPTYTGFHNIIKRRTLLPLAEETIKEMAQAGCGRNMTPAAFAQYWQGEEGSAVAAAPVSSERRSCNGRSLQEISDLLQEEGDAGEFSDADTELFVKFFTQLKPETAKRNPKLLAMDISGIALRMNGVNLEKVIAPMRSKAAFWPETPAKASYDALSLWGDLPAKNLEGLAKATIIAFDDEYLTECALVLPLKALNSICILLDSDQIYDAAKKVSRCSCDLLMWIWKNRKKHKHDELLSLVNIENVCRALNVTEEPPRAWNAALRELKTSLMDKSDFQQFVLENCSGVEEFAIVLQGATFLGPRDRQSLLAKMARNSESLREYLENGAAHKLINANAKKEDSLSAPKETAEFTSALSRQRMQDELDDLINVQIPENREALKTARAHGDFRENAEFDAAKERRNFLRRRREELEHDLGTIQAMLMKDVTVDNTAVIGSVVEVEFSDSGKDSFFLLGARDGDPDKKYLSYRSRLGAAILGHSVGDTFEVPGNRTCKLCAVKALPAALVAELDA